MNKDKIGLRPPWVLYHEKVKALFGGDKDISVEFDDELMKMTIRVNSARKADALSRLIPGMVNFGDVIACICVVPPNSSGETLPDDASPIDVISAAFEGNPVVSQIRAVSKGIFRDLCYCVFKKEVVQYPADNLGDVNGNESTLMQCIAQEVLENAEGVYFCTSSGLSDAPLGEWP